jgi:hypothetical protein
VNLKKGACFDRKKINKSEIIKIMENTAIASTKLRDFFSEMNILTRSDGSVLSTQGNFVFSHTTG